MACTQQTLNCKPHVSAKAWLQQWRPYATRTVGDLPLSPVDINRITNVLGHAWADGTLSTYGTGLLTFHVFCDTRGIPEPLQFPASTTLMVSFIALAAGAYSGKTLANYFYAIRTWHIIHGVRWSMDRDQMDAMLKAALALAPASSKHPPHKPYTVEGIALLIASIDTSQPLGAAAASCFTTAFWGVARVGELTLPNLNAFDPNCHVK